jgi:hypothetical protein
MAIRHAHERMISWSFQTPRTSCAGRYELVADVVVDRLSIDGALERRMLEENLDLRREEETAAPRRSTAATPRRSRAAKS